MRKILKNNVYLEEIDFYPKGKSFSFRFSKDTCEKISTGKCNVEGMAPYKYNMAEFERRCNGFKCSNIAVSLIKNGFVHHPGAGILIYKHACGHYSFNNGQHRTCLAAKLNVYVRAEVKELDSTCAACQYDKKLIYL
jgi:hypothetical protein